MAIIHMTLTGENYTASTSLTAAGTTDQIKIPDDAWDVGFQLVLGATTSGYVQASLDGINYDTWPNGTITGGNKTGSADGAKHFQAVQTTAGTLTLNVHAKRK